MAARRDINIYKGDTYTHSVTLQDSNTSAIDVSTRTYVAQVKNSAASTEVIASFDIDTSDAENGVVVLTLSSTQTRGLKTGNYYYDLEETADSVITTLMFGDAIVSGG
jgi:hypothetical protein